MAFLGGLQGLGALAGGVEQGIGSGLNLNTYLQNQQAQNLAGNVLQAYGGGQPSTGGGGILGGLANLFGGGQQASAAPAQPMGGLNSAAGQTPIGSQADVPGLPAGQPGTANPLTNLFGGGQQAAPGMSPLAQQQPSLSQPQQQPQQADPSQSGSQPQPFDASQRMTGGQQQQMTLPQFVQLARRVNPNASGGQIYRGAIELARGGLLGYGGMSPYQAAQLAREQGLDEWHIKNIQNEMDNRDDERRHRATTEQESRAKEADAQADKGVTEALSNVNEAKSALKENRDAQGRARSVLKDLVGDPDQSTAEWKSQYKSATDQLSDLRGEEKTLTTDLHAAEKAHADSVKSRQENAAKAAKSYGSGGDRGQGDYANTPDGKMMHYKGSGSRDDASNWEEVQ